MDASKIRVGDALKLKKNRAEAYGLPVDTKVPVVSTFTRPGYKALWVDSPLGKFPATDFAS